MTPQSKTENIVNSWNTACHVFPALISFLYEPRTAILSPKSGVEWGGWGGGVTLLHGDHTCFYLIPYQELVAGLNRPRMFSVTPESSSAKV